MLEEQTQETVQENAPPEKKKKGFLKVIIIGLVAAGLAGGGGYYFYGRTWLAQRGGKQVACKVREKTEIGPILPLEPFIINVSGNSSRFVKISVALELKNEKAIEQTKKMSPVIRDSMLAVLGAKTPEVFMDVKGRTAMKKELFDSIDRLFADGGLKAVYITDIIMQ